jgi:hypothetical protein
MFKVSALLAVISAGLTVWCLVEAISAKQSRIRRLPKLAWILLILFVPLAGSIAWLVAGRPSAAVERAAAAAAFAEFERPGRLDPSDPGDPARDEAYRKLLRERAEEQRRRYEQQKKDQDKRKTDKPEPD